MSDITFEFNRQKAIEAIVYLAERITDPTFHSINKLLYFADKTSLERYGRFISGDDYCAMELGPVPSKTYDLMKQGAHTKEHGFEVKGYHVIPLREPDLDWFSESDIECLDKSIQMYGSVPFWKRKQDSHDQAWQKAWAARGDTSSVPIKVELIAEQLEHAEDLIHYLANRHAD